MNNTILRIHRNEVNGFIKGFYNLKMYYTSNGLAFELHNIFRIYVKFHENRLGIDEK